MSPEFKKAQENMKPGVITADGFLGEDRRSVVKIIAADEKRMEKLGLRFDETAQKLEYLMQQGRKGLGEPVTIDNTWLVKTDEARGHLPSPFQDGIFRKINATITRLDGPKTEFIRISQLSLHLMRQWHFLQGKGASFRIEPDTLRNVLSP